MSRLAIVRAQPAPEEKSPPVDIYAADRAKIKATDWCALHIRGDRAEPVSLPDRVRGGWRR